MKLEAPDIDEDGVVGGTEMVTQSMDQGITHVQQPTELGEVFNSIFPQQVTNSTKMLGNIHEIEESYILLFISLNAMKILPKAAKHIAHEKLMLSVSRNARGRDDAVNSVVGKKEQDAKMGMGGMGDKFKQNFLGLKNE